MSLINNVDQREIDKFDAMAASWWQPNGDFKPLHQLNPLRLDYIQQKAQGIFGKKILDVGCGGGILSESMARQGAQVTGLDMAPLPLQVARQHAAQQNLSIEYRQESVEQHSDSGLYDIVTCMELLEHVPSPQGIINACARLVKPGGHVFFSTINRNCKAWFMLIAGAEYIANMVPKGTHNADKFIRPSELIHWASLAGLQDKSIIGIKYQLLRQNFSLTHNVDVNYILHTQPVITTNEG